jgi:uncharacterized membrane protein
MKIQNTIDIDTSPARVWELTLDVESWPDHTSTMTSIEKLDPAPLAVGSRVKIKQPAQRAKVWTVTALEPQRLFAWTAKMLGTTMTAAHHIDPTPTGVRQTLSVDITGALSWPVGMLVRGPIAKAIATENQGFKRAAESANH